MLLNAIKGYLTKKKIGEAYKKRYKSTGLNWYRIKYLKHVNKSELKYYPLFGKKLSYKNGGELIHGLTEIFADEIYKITLPEHAKIIDCGANIGLSVLYLKKEHPGASIIAFEPDPTNFELLRSNIAAFGLNGIEAKMEAVWDKNETLFFEDSGSQASHITDTPSHAIQVKATRLRDVITEKIDFLKIDIEGAENRVLPDIADKLHLVGAMFVEYHGSFKQNREFLDILDIINKAGFSFYIKEAADFYKTPFLIEQRHPAYDVQLNVFCIRE